MRATASLSSSPRAACSKDAAELVEVDYEPPRPSPTWERPKDSAPLVHDEYEHNRAYTWPLQTGEVDKLFSEAAVTVRSTTASSA